MHEEGYPESVDLVWFIEHSEWQQTTCSVETIHLSHVIITCASCDNHTI